MTTNWCCKCYREDPTQEERELAYEMDYAMARYTGISLYSEEDWCHCCKTCGGDTHDYKCVCKCEHGLSVYDQCWDCMTKAMEEAQ